MDAAFLVLVALGLLASVFTYVSKVLSGGTTAKVAGSSEEHRRVIEDLGPVRRAFTNYTPWRFRFGVLMLATGTACAVIGRIMDIQGLLLAACFALLFGIATILYVAFMRIDHLELHSRGLFLRQGKTKVTAMYYTEIVQCAYRTVTFTTRGVQGRPIAKGLVITLLGGGSLDVGTDFMQFGQIADAITELVKTCQAEQRLCGTYIVTGRTLNDDESREVQIEARSPRQARIEALNRYGVIAEDCYLSSEQG